MGAEAMDVVVVGAGFAGLDMLRVLSEDGWKCVAVEKGADVGGTWYHNRYPGARCDVESTTYSYQFDDVLQQEYEWKMRYPQQSDIQAYLRHVAERYDLYKNIHFNTSLNRAVWDESANMWNLELEGEITKITTKYIVTAVGCLSAPIHPKIPGSFDGPIYHTAMWPKDAEYEGKRVAIIGTGSSAVQAIPELAKTAQHLYVLQRTPNYVFEARQRNLSPELVKRIKADYTEIRAINNFGPSASGMHQMPKSAMASALAVDEEYRNRVYERMWEFGGFPLLFSFNDLFFDPLASASLKVWMKGKIASIVHDRSVAEQLAPTTALGCKRPCFGSNFYETFNLPNVSLVNVKDKVLQYCKDGLKVDETKVEVDMIVTATGFDAITGSLTRIDIIGKNGMSLKEVWKDGPHTLLGLQVVGFPNFFTITGPASPSVLTNMVPTIEQHVEWIRKFMNYMKSHNVVYCEAEDLAQKQWGAHCTKLIEQSVYPGCNSWYLGSNVPGKARATYIYTGGLPPYAQHCEEVAIRGYPGFCLLKNDGSGVPRPGTLTSSFAVWRSRVLLFRKFMSLIPILGKYGPDGIESPNMSAQIAYLVSKNKSAVLQFIGKLATFIALLVWFKRFLFKRQV